MLMMGLRLGTDPRVVVATTPRPIALLRELAADPLTRVTRGSTFDNRANLAPAYLDQILTKYQGTQIGRQELYAKLLDEAPGALWKRADIERHRVKAAPALLRIVVAVDPAATSGERADDTGIVEAGKAKDGQGYVLADLTCHKSPDGWAREVVKAYHEWKADRIVVETNHGGEMVTATIRQVDRNVPIKTVTASRGKMVRAEPISALYEQGRVHHVGAFPALEDQLVNWTPDSGTSPDRLDALVWALTELLEARKIVIV
jgi:phage terminase large subunit-like protein